MSTPTVNYDYLLWDWNGTLYNDVDASIKSINISLKEYNLPLLDKERYMEIFAFPLRNTIRNWGLILRWQAMTCWPRTLYGIF